MAETKMMFRLLTPERAAIEQAVDEVIVPGVHGYIGFRPGRLPFLTEIGVGVVTYKVGGRELYAAVSGGFAEALPDRVTVLTEVAELASEIDLDRAKEARDRALERLQGSDQDIDLERARAALNRAVTRIALLS